MCLALIGEQQAGGSKDEKTKKKGKYTRYRDTATWPGSLNEPHDSVPWSSHMNR